MDKKIMAELERRCNVVIAHAVPGEISTGMTGSRVMFCIAICTMGYPFANPPEWMDKEHLKPLISREDYSYEDFITGLFQKAYAAVNKETL
jgi:hypothetical protein